MNTPGRPGNAPENPASLAALAEALGKTPEHYVVLRGPSLLIDYANDSFLRDWNLDAGVVGTEIFKTIPEWATRKLHELLRIAWHTGERHTGHIEELPGSRERGTEALSMKFIIQPLSDKENQVTGLLLSATDVTAELAVIRNNLEMEAAANRLRQLYEAVTANTPDLIYVFDLQYRFSYANNALLQMWGKTWDNAIGKGLRENGYEEWHARLHEREIDQIVASKQPIRGEVSFPHATLGKRIYDYLLVPVLNLDGDVAAVAGTTRDISDIRQAEDLMKDNEEKLKVLVEKRTSELRQSNEELQRFAHVASHDLKEPLRKIKLYSGRIRDFAETSHSPALVGYSEKIEKSSARMQAMIDGVLNYSSISGMEIAPETIDVNEIVRSVSQDLEVVIERSAASISFENLPAVAGSAVLINQLFYNLIANSLKFQKKGASPVILIRATPEPQDTVQKQPMVRFHLTDNGIGFSKDDQARIFQTFTRLNPKDQFEGTGLGLTLCKQIVERHGGTIVAHSLTEGGADFDFTLPAAG